MFDHWDSGALTTKWVLLPTPYTFLCNDELGCLVPRESSARSQDSDESPAAKTPASRSQRTTLQHTSRRHPLIYHSGAWAARPRGWFSTSLPKEKQAERAGPGPPTPGPEVAVPSTRSPAGRPWRAASPWRSPQRRRLQSSPHARSGPTGPVSVVRWIVVPHGPGKPYLSPWSTQARSFPSGPAKRNDHHLSCPLPTSYWLWAQSL